MIPFRGRKGQNAATFAGRVRGRSLERGVYLITISPNRRLVPNAPTEYVRVASARRTVRLPEAAPKPTCSTERALAADPTARFLRNEARPAATAAPSARRPEAPLRPPLQSTLPALTPNDPDDALPFPLPTEAGSVTDGSVGEVVATIVVLAIIAVLLIVALLLATRVVRRGLT